MSMVDMELLSLEKSICPANCCTKARMLLKSLLIIGASNGLILGSVGVAVSWFSPKIFSPDPLVMQETEMEHQRIKAEIELGNGLLEIRLTTQCLKAAKQVGFKFIGDYQETSGVRTGWGAGISLHCLPASSIGTMCKGEANHEQEMDKGEELDLT